MADGIMALRREVRLVRAAAVAAAPPEPPQHHRTR